MSAPQIAIKQGDRVSLWCRVTRRHKTGTINFLVINGYWNGSIKADGTIAIEGGRYGETQGEICWQGHAPFAESRYNEAIAWIEEQLAHG
ncbi:hypothetical protein QUC32_23005 [Novosphingobium resinovorum]|uniref:hypothetical protein n=1 Tax=Novosphingobium TaxID=165696 RepID=UPI001B3C90F9|nr:MULTISPECIES: hypothetical protein [Novosphingobium]MBF7012521.1 hypothetical protein [Novosphingobium sp. HR1a]WJM27255.1 hypothetical protein QUC32_23005 [Novosphingobium resinovorum]